MKTTNLLKRAQSHNNRQTLSNLLHSRGTSPQSQPDIISGHKLVEEETLPKYNPDHFYPVRLGDVLQNRYEVVAKLGYGMTATVWLAKDLQSDGRPGNHKYVTIKININTLSLEFQKGRREIAQKLYSANPKHPGYGHVRFMLDTFRVRGKHGEHLCIVYDVLREPIDICMEKFPGRRFSPAKLRILLSALFQGLDYLHSECKVVHTDLKADNIMMGLGDPNILDHFVQHEAEHPSPRKMPDSHGRIIYSSCSDFGEPPTEAVIASAKITDIGLAAWGEEKNTKPIQSNAFMAPEVILQCGWSYPADIWNLGVMLWDLFEHFGLFDSIDTRPSHYRPEKHLGLMIALLGPPPKELLKRGAKSYCYFDSEGNFKTPEDINPEMSWEASVSRVKGEEKELFLDFAKKMITWLPEDRWTAKQLLDHPFITKEREYLPTPSLSRASTASSLSFVPSRTGTPGLPSASTSHSGAPSTSLPLRLTELTTTNSRDYEAGDAKLARMPSVPETSTLTSNMTSATPTLPGKEGDDELANAKMNANKSNRSSQDLIDSILNRGKPQRASKTPSAEST